MRFYTTDRSSAQVIDRDSPVTFIMRAAQEALDHLPKQQKLAAMKEVAQRLDSLREVIETEETE